MNLLGFIPTKISVFYNYVEYRRIHMLLLISFMRLLKIFKSNINIIQKY